MMINYLMIAGGVALLLFEGWSWVERQGGVSRFFKRAEPTANDESDARLDAVEAIDEILVDCERFNWAETAKHARAAVRALYADGGVPDA